LIRGSSRTERAAAAEAAWHSVRPGSSARNRACERPQSRQPTRKQRQSLAIDQLISALAVKNAERSFEFYRKVLCLIKVYDQGGGWIQGQTPPGAAYSGRSIIGYR
jgi:hypothetical protein